MSCAASNSNLANELIEDNETNPLIIENNLQYNTHNYETFVGVRVLGGGKKSPHNQPRGEFNAQEIRSRRKRKRH